MHSIRAGIFWLLIVFFSNFVQADLNLPELLSRVNDYTNTLNPTEKNELEGKLSFFEQKKGSQIVIAIIPSTGDFSIEEYAVKLQEKWKVGRKNIDDGILIVLAKNDRKIKIEVGYGLEGVVTDLLAHRIIDEKILPEFKVGNYYLGLNAAVDTLIKVIDGEPLPPPSNHSAEENTIEMLLPLLIFGIAFAQPLHAGLKRLLGMLPSALVIASTVSLFSASFLPLVYVLMVGVFYFFALLLGNMGSGGRYSSRGYGGSYGGGSSFGGGGFSGGGGSSGGGGASGSW